MSKNNNAAKKPIIVIGMNRSGTKWLSNILCNHTEIAGIQSENAKGILETNLFGTMQKKFDLNYLDEYLGFIHLWSKTNFFKRTKYDIEKFYVIKPRPKNYYEIFGLVMDNYAELQNKSYWLQKCSARNCEPIIEYFNGAHLIFIKRDIIDTLKSTFKLKNKKLDYELNKKFYGFYHQVFIYVHDEKNMQRFFNLNNSIYVNYEDLKNNQEQIVKNICTSIGIEFDKKMINVSFDKNTSFDLNKDKEEFFTKFEKIKIKIFYKILKLIPFFLLSFLKNLGNRFYNFRHYKPAKLIPGTFSDYKFKYDMK